MNINFKERANFSTLKNIEKIILFWEKETKIPKTRNYKQIIKYVNNFKKEFKKQWLDKNKDWFNFYLLID